MNERKFFVSYGSGSLRKELVLDTPEEVLALRLKLDDGYALPSLVVICGFKVEFEPVEMVKSYRIKWDEQ